MHFGVKVQCNRRIVNWRFGSPARPVRFPDRPARPECLVSRRAKRGATESWEKEKPSIRDGQRAVKDYLLNKCIAMAIVQIVPMISKTHSFRLAA